jgi:hypothetical protein
MTGMVLNANKAYDKIIYLMNVKEKICIYIRFQC